MYYRKKVFANLPNILFCMINIINEQSTNCWLSLVAWSHPARIHLVAVPTSQATVASSSPTYDVHNYNFLFSRIMSTLAEGSIKLLKLSLAILKIHLEEYWRFHPCYLCQPNDSVERPFRVGLSTGGRGPLGIATHIPPAPAALNTLTLLFGEEDVVDNFCL